MEPLPTSANLILPQAGLKWEPQRTVQMPTNEYKQQTKGCFVLGRTSPTGGLGVAESKAQVLGQTAFRKLRRERAIPCFPRPPWLSPLHLGNSLHHPGGCTTPSELPFIHPALLEREVRETPGVYLECLDSWNRQKTSKFSKTDILA